MSSHSVLHDPDISRIIDKKLVRCALRDWDVSDILVFVIWRQVAALPVAFGDDRHELGAHPAQFALGADVCEWNRCAAQQTLRAVFAYCPAARCPGRAADLEPDVLALGQRVDVALLAILAA